MADERMIDMVSLAEAYIHGFQLINEAVRQIRTWILQARHGLRCVHEPWQSPGACCMYCGHCIEAVQG